MTTVLAPQPDARALSADGGCRRPGRCRCAGSCLTFVRNPLSSLPRPVYEEPIVVHDNGHNVVA